mgnify:CR=1 FL=1
MQEEEQGHANYKPFQFDNLEIWKFVDALMMKMVSLTNQQITELANQFKLNL